MKVSQLPPLDPTTIDGNETVPAVKGSKLWRATLAQLTAFAVAKAEGFAAAAQFSAGAGEFDTPAKGLADTNIGEAFWCDNGNSTGIIYRHDAGPTATPLQTFIMDMTAPGAAKLIGASGGSVQASLDSKAATSHTHTIPQVTGLQAALNGKANTSHTHDASEITSGDISDRLRWMTLSYEDHGRYVGIGDGSVTVIAAGEARSAWEASGISRNLEDLFLIADSSICLQAGVQSGLNPDRHTMYLHSSGNVGVGTNSPSAKLHIQVDGGDAELLIKATGDGADNEAILTLDSALGGESGIEFKTNGGTRKAYIESYLDGGYTAFGTETGSNLGILFRTNGSDAVYMDTNSRIGIGTRTPSELVEIYGATPNLVISNTSETTAGIIFNDAQAVTSQSASIKFDAGSSNDLVLDSTGKVRVGADEIGFKNVPRFTVSSGSTAGLEHRGRCIAVSGTLNIPNGVFDTGDVISIFNASSSNLTLKQASGSTMRLAGTTSTGDRTVGPFGLATIWFHASGSPVVSGAGVS